MYRVSPGETLRDVVESAGGLTAHSYLYASILTRVSTRHAQEEELRQATEQDAKRTLRPLCEFHSDYRSNRGGPTSAACLSAKRTGQVIFEQADWPGCTGIEIRCNHHRGHPRLLAGRWGHFLIPPRLSTVQVAGSVYNANAFRHQPEKRLVAYLNDAGGATREADTKRIFVIHADGTVVSRHPQQPRL